MDDLKARIAAQLDDYTRGGKQQQPDEITVKDYMRIRSEQGRPVSPAAAHKILKRAFEDGVMTRRFLSDGKTHAYKLVMPVTAPSAA